MGLSLKGNGNSNGGKFEQHLPKEGARPARLVEIYDIGVHEREFKGA